MSKVQIQVLSKSENEVSLFFNKIDGAVASVNVYVSLTDVTGNYVQVLYKIPNIPDKPRGDDRVSFKLKLEDVRSLEPTITWSAASFMTTPLFLRGTTVDTSEIESDIAISLSKFVGVVGITPGYMTDNPSSNSHSYAFSSAARGWARVASSAAGSLSTSRVEYYEDNFIIDRVVSGGNVTQELIYLASDPVGSYAKLITYEGPFSTDGKATKVTYSDSIKP